MIIENVGCYSAANRLHLRVGQTSTILREHLAMVFRDTDGVTRRVQHIGPVDGYDKHSKLAEDAIIEEVARVDRHEYQTSSGCRRA